MVVGNDTIAQVNFTDSRMEQRFELLSCQATSFHKNHPQGIFEMRGERGKVFTGGANPLSDAGHREIK